METSPAPPLFSKVETSLSFEEYVIDGRKQDCVPIKGLNLQDFSGLTDRSRLEHIGYDGKTVRVQLRVEQFSSKT